MYICIRMEYIYRYKGFQVHLYKCLYIDKGHNRLFICFYATHLKKREFVKIKSRKSINFKDNLLKWRERLPHYCEGFNTLKNILEPRNYLFTNLIQLVKEKYPTLLKCMSTNGLLLAERAEEVIDVGIDSLTVTVNAVEPEIEAKINSAIIFHGKKYEGIEAAEILIKNQLEGIKKVSDAGITVKVNTVLIPGINEEHIEEVAKAVSDAGATIYNIIPLIPQFELSDIPAPTCMEIDGARVKAEKYIDVFRHCQRCRADAVGVPGESDFGDRIYQRRISHKDTFSHG